ncbi:MAG: DUF4349 domain-containing protein [Deltaproteobacteria bacterium]|nr:DUF4349 domain-containing protein [Deltaproteobacteria bacterium]
MAVVSDQNSSFMGMKKGFSMNLRLKILSFCFCILTLLSACSQKSPQSLLESSQKRDDQYINSSPSMAADEEDYSKKSLQTQDRDESSAALTKLDALYNRKLIYQADLNIEIKKYEETYQEVQSIVKELGGFIADLQVNEGEDKKRSAHAVIRVGESVFHEAVSKLKKIGDVKFEQINAQDITEEYTDLEARLKNKRELEKRLIDVLQKRAGKLSDILEVERELARVREGIEQIEGRKRFLDDRITLSTITLNFYEPSAITSISQWKPLKESLKDITEIFAKSLGSLLMVLAALLPWLLLGSLFIYLTVKWIKRKFFQKANSREKASN